MSLKTRIPTTMDNDIQFDGKRDMMQVYDPFKKQWLDWKRTGKVILPSTITVTTSTLDGEPVTCQINNESYTTTFISGVAVFKVYSLGTATITCGTYSTTVNVETDSGEYSANLESEIVLWNGANLLNGATFFDVYNSIRYDSDSFNLDKTTLYFKYNTSQNIMVTLALCNGSDSRRCFINNAGSCVTTSTSYTFNADTVYCCPFSEIISKSSAIENVKYIVFQAYSSFGNNTTTTNNLAKLWLQ